MAANIDLRAIADRADLPALMASEGIEVVRGMAFCPFHDNRTSPAMSVFTGSKRRWRFRCYGCSAQGDALEWLTLRNPGMTVIEAARIIDPSIADADHSAPVRPRPADAPHQPTPRPHLETVEPWRDAQWQEEADRIVRLGERKLWGPEGRAARQWLNARGIQDHTAQLFRLGFLDHDVYSRAPIRANADADKPGGRKLWTPRGITIPWVAPGASYIVDEEDDPAAPRWCGVNIRRLGELVDDGRIFAPPEQGRKCVLLVGSRPGYGYPYPDLLPSQAGPPALIVEGEWDALIAHQDAGHLIHAITTGGAKADPKPSTLAFLDQCPAWLVVADRDEAGTESEATWIDRGRGRVRPLRLPTGKDLSDFRKAGGDVADLIRAKLARLASRPAETKGVA